MDSSMTQPECKHDPKIVAEASVFVSLFRGHKELFRAYAEATDEVQAIIVDMVEILCADDAEDGDRVMAMNTLVEALFPSSHNGELGIEISELRKGAPEEVVIEMEAMDSEEAAFADRLKALMADKGFTQQNLADLVGVGQPAISMMLNRKCRPQRATVEKIARGLGVKPYQLWPDF